MDFRFSDLLRSAGEGAAALCAEHPLLLAGFLVTLALIYRSAWRFQVHKARQGYLRFQAKRVGVALLVFGGALLALSGPHTNRWLASFLAASVALVSVVFVRPPKQTRYIPVKVRKAVLRRDLGQERRNDSRLHAIDHRVPYSKGGENTVNNLRVLGRVENARKRDRMPTRQDFQKRPGRRVVVRPPGLFWFALEGMVSVWAFWEVLRQAH